MTMLCPLCRTEMLTLEWAEIEVDYCRECGGWWLDSGEARLIGDRAGSLRPGLLAALDAGLKSKRDPGRKRRCPVCAKRMARVRPPELAPAGADRCRHRHGLWFDRAELQKALEIAGTGRNSPLARFLADLERQRQKELASSAPR